MKSVIRTHSGAREDGLRDRVKVIVGGAPLNAKFAHDIGADGYGADAGSSVDLARRLLKG